MPTLIFWICWSRQSFAYWELEQRLDSGKNFGHSNNSYAVWFTASKNGPNRSKMVQAVKTVQNGKMFTRLFHISKWQHYWRLGKIRRWMHCFKKWRQPRRNGADCTKTKENHLKILYLKVRLPCGLRWWKWKAEGPCQLWKTSQILMECIEYFHFGY